MGNLDRGWARMKSGKKRIQTGFTGFTGWNFKIREKSKAITTKTSRSVLLETHIMRWSTNQTRRTL